MQDICVCGAPGVMPLAWECRNGHRREVRMCLEHGRFTAACIYSGQICCSRCRSQTGQDVKLYLVMVDGRPVSRRGKRRIIHL